LRWNDRRRCARRRGAIRALLVAASSALLLAACGGNTSAPSGPGVMLSTLENWTALETPVDQALGILTQECMAQHGFRYYPFPQPGQPGGPPLFASAMFGSTLWLGPQSLAWRIVNGWGLYEEIMQQLSQPGGFFGGQPQEMRVMQSLPGSEVPTYMRTLWGGGKTMKIRIPGLPGVTFQIGGCNTTAGKQLFGSVAASVAVPQYGPAILMGTVQASAQRSPALRASQARWAACVRAGTGIRVPSPSQLFMHFYSLYQSVGPTPSVHRKELAAAVTDLACQRRARLPQTLQQAAVDAVRRLPPSVLGELQTLLSVLDQARERARAVFAHSSLPAATKAPNIGGSAVTQSPGPGGGVGRVVFYGG
jgi:hypothetical protein